MTATPYCNVPIAQPPGDPTAPTGFQRASAGMSLDQLVNIMNANFALLAKGNFTEDRSKRITNIVALTDPANPTVKINIEVISAVTFKNAQTGQTVVWKR